MAAEYRAHASAASYGSRINTTIAKPTGTAEGDELVMMFLLGAENLAAIPTPTFPSGWDIVGGPFAVSQNNDTGIFSVRSWLLRKRAGDSEGASYTVTHSSAPSDGIIVAVSGAEDNASPQVTSNSGFGTGDITFLSVTTERADAWIGAFCHNWDLWGAGTAPGGTTPTFTERQDSGTHLIHFSEGTFSGTGATGNKAKDSDNANVNYPWGCFLVALEVPEAGGGDPEGGLVAGKLLRGGLLMGGRLVR